jgi:hypothetical protein
LRALGDQALEHEARELAARHAFGVGVLLDAGASTRDCTSVLVIGSELTSATMNSAERCTGAADGAAGRAAGGGPGADRRA